MTHAQHHSSFVVVNKKTGLHVKQLDSLGAARGEITRQAKYYGHTKADFHVLERKYETRRIGEVEHPAERVKPVKDPLKGVKPELPVFQQGEA